MRYEHHDMNFVSHEMHHGHHFGHQKVITLDQIRAIAAYEDAVDGEWMHA